MRETMTFAGTYVEVRQRPERRAASHAQIKVHKPEDSRLDRPDRAVAWTTGVPGIDERVAILLPP